VVPTLLLEDGTTFGALIGTPSDGGILTHGIARRSWCLLSNESSSSHVEGG
jgi:hypothetical protein